MAQTIIQHFPPHKIYVEPFGGAASILLNKPRSYAEVYNDLFPDVVNVMKVLRNPEQAEQLRRACELTPFSRDEFYSKIDRSEPVEWARGVIFRSFAGFGSGASSSLEYPTGFRNNCTRSGSTPASVWANWPQGIVDYVSRLRGVVIENRPALEVMRQHDGPETLHYLDPPYLKETRYKTKRNVYEFEMTDQQHIEMLITAKEMQGKVIISGYRSDMYDEALKGWHRVDFGTFADGAKKRTESIWMNYHNLTLFN